MNRSVRCASERNIRLPGFRSAPGTRTESQPTTTPQLFVLCPANLI